MMATYPPRGLTPWDAELKQYIDDEIVAAKSASKPASQVAYGGIGGFPASSVEAAIDTLASTRWEITARRNAQNEFTHQQRIFSPEFQLRMRNTNGPENAREWGITALSGNGDLVVRPHTDDGLPTGPSFDFMRNGDFRSAGVQEVRRGGSAMRRIVRTNNPAEAKGWQEAVSAVTGDYSLDLINDDGSWRSSGFAVYRDRRGIYGGVAYLKGTGSPEGVLSAPQGSRYVDTAGTNGAWVWLKKSGGGNTGWVVTNGDTGWRDVTSSLVNGWVANFVRVRRVNQEVVWAISGLDGAAASGTSALLYPAGFAPDSELTVSTLIRPASGSAPWILSLGSISSPTLAGVPSSGASHVNVAMESVIARGSWPTTLPGTPA